MSPSQSTIDVEVFLQTPWFEGEVPTGSDAGMIAIADQMALREAPWLQWFQTWLVALEGTWEAIAPSLSTPALGYELTLRLTDDAEIQTLNATYRQSDRPTDVLSFAALETDAAFFNAPEEDAPLYLGDLIISLETAQRQAQERGHTLLEEVVWLASHGLLHLLGWDHPDEPSLARMLQQQEDLLQTVGLKIQYDYPKDEC